ncbi:serine/threonine-protein kinase [Microbacterium sp. NPDC087589]|uniref:serine/threonine-protein kinase n=1 Tax=Microbacterium sp. NPDC087589 TaxID=3364191 RepID=UPI003824B6B4
MTLEVVSPTAALLDGRYLLHDRVGQGGMATVYRAEDTHLGRIVAIKMIHESTGPVASIERAHTEKALLASLSHPSLVTLYDAQLTPGRPQYLVMEFVDGPTLAGRMAEGPLPPRDVARITRDLAEGLAAVHAAGIVHRDVKPSNVLLARSRLRRPVAAKLADFGIACSIEDTRLTTPGIVLGTLTYMAPEQLRDADPGTPVDIFALGLVVLEALSGETGYAALGSGRAAAIARLSQTPTISETVPEEWRDLLTHMTRLEPEERPTAAEVARAARGLLRGYVTDDNGSAVAAAAAAIVASAGADSAARATAADPGAESPDGSTAAAESAAQRPDAVGVATGPDAGRSDAVGASPTGATAVLPARGVTAAVGVAAATDAPASRTRTRTRNRVLAGAAGLVATGAIVVGLAAFTAPASAELSRTASSPVVRVPAQTTPEDVPADTPAAPVQVVTEPVDSAHNGNSGIDGNSGQNGNSGNAGNDGNSGSTGNDGNNGNSGDKGNKDNPGKGDKGDKGKGGTG